MKHSIAIGAEVSPSGEKTFFSSNKDVAFSVTATF